MARSVWEWVQLEIVMQLERMLGNSWEWEVQVPERKRTTIIKQIRIVMVTIKAFIVLDFTHRRAKAMAAIIIGH